MKSRFVKVLLLLAVALLFIRPKLNAPAMGPFAELFLLVYLGALPLWVTAKWKRREWTYLHSFSPVLIYVLVVYLFSDGTDYEGIRRVSRSCVDVIAIVVVLYHAKRHFGDDTLRLILCTMTLAAAIQAATMYAMFVSPAFNSHITAWFGVPGERSYMIAERASGFQSRGGDSLAMNQAIGAFAAYILFRSHRGISRVKYLLLTFFILVATLLAARSGVIVFLAAVWVYPLRALLFGDPLAKVKLVAAAVSLVLTVYLVFPFLVPLALDVSHGYNNPVTRAFEPIRRYYLEGKIRTTSSDRLMRMFSVLPDSGTRFLFGNSHYGRQGSEYVKSDVGYIRFLHGAGLVGVLLSMIPFVLVVSYALRCKNSHLIAVAVLGMVGHLKIIYLYSGPFLIVLSIFYLCGSRRLCDGPSVRLNRATPAGRGLMQDQMNYVR